MINTPLVNNELAGIRTFIHWDRIGASFGAAIAAVGNVFWIQEMGLWVVVLAILLLVGLLTLAARLVEQDRMLVSLASLTIGNWLVAAVVSHFVPFLWPVMVITVLMPVVLATPHLAASELIPAIAATALLVSLVAALGLLNDDGGVIEDVDDNFELAVVISALVGHIVPVGLIVWQNNQLQHNSYDRLQRSQRELAASRDRVVQAADTERRRIERDLHDGAQQRLVSLGVRLRLLETQTAESPEVHASVETLVGELDAAVEEVRELAHGIYPPLLQTRGLKAALGAVVRRSPLAIDAGIDDIGRFDPSIETALYFASLEALTNAAKHAPDSTVLLTVARNDDRIDLTVRDDGPGFDPDEQMSSHGTHNMGDRLAAVGGTLAIRSSPGEGTTVTASVPLDG